MKRSNNGFFHSVFVLISLPIVFGSGLCMDPFSYVESLKPECLMEPPQPNNTGKDFQELKINENRGNEIIVERVDLQKGNIYSISSWIKLRNENEGTVRVTLRGENVTYIDGGQVIAKKGCWSLLKGGFIVNVSVPFDIFFKGDGLVTTEISVQNVRLKRFSKTQWKLQQDQVIEKVLNIYAQTPKLAFKANLCPYINPSNKVQIRKNKVTFQVSFQNASAVKESVISIKMNKPSFLFGCAMNNLILGSDSYREWFVSRFRLTSFTNEMKWYTNEAVRGQEDYTLADAMMNIAEENEILVKGHTVLWDDKNWQPTWVQAITDPEDLRKVTLNRINSVMTRYKGRLIGWDVMNENVHFTYFEDMLGKNFSAIAYSLASKLDPDIPLFINEYNTVEYTRERVGSPINVKNRMEEIVSFPGNMNIKGGIGAQAHFTQNQPNLAYMRSALDTLGSLGFPVWLTEVDVPQCPDQAKYMEDILREAYSHPAVKGIIVYGGPEMAGFNKLTLTDKDFNNTEAGDVIDKLLQEWQQEPAEILIQNHEHNDEEGRIIGVSPEISLLDGHYTATVTNPGLNLSTNFSFEVTKEMGHLQLVQLKVDA